MRGAQRTLRVNFDSPEAFRQEYASNLAHGGVFIPTEETADARERVRVEFFLTFSGDRFNLAGEVVHSVAPEMAEMGAPAGIAVQFEGSADMVRKRLEPLCAITGASAPKPTDPGKRCAPRAHARVPAQIAGKGGEVAGQTRNISQSGVLVSTRGKGVPVGEKVRLSLSHPTSGESMEVDGLVVRDIQADGGVSGLGIAFEPPEKERAELERFVEGIQNTEHTRRLGGITGEIGEVGIQSLVQMFMNSVPTGTLTLQQGEHEGVIGFEGGMLCFTRLGAVSGRKALGRLLAWTAGRFEFHASLDSFEEREAAVPVDAALLDAVRLIDESARIDLSQLPADAKPRVARADTEGEDLSKVELTVLELAQAGFTVQRMVDLIPEPDPEIYRTLVSLLERGNLSI